MSQHNPPLWFWLTCVFALIWNIMGFAAFYAQISISPEALAQLPQIEQDLYTQTPVWVNIAFAIATIGGSLGCIGLLMRANWSITLFQLSLAAVVVQMSYSLLFSDALAIYGSSALVMPTLVLLIAIGLLLLAIRLKNRKWIV